MKWACLVAGWLLRESLVGPWTWREYVLARKLQNAENEVLALGREAQGWRERCEIDEARITELLGRDAADKP